MMSGCEPKKKFFEKIQNGRLAAILAFLHKLLYLRKFLTDFNEI